MGAIGAIGGAIVGLVRFRERPKQAARKRRQSVARLAQGLNIWTARKLGCVSGHADLIHHRRVPGELCERRSFAPLAGGETPETIYPSSEGDKPCNAWEKSAATIGKVSEVELLRRASLELGVYTAGASYSELVLGIAYRLSVEIGRKHLFEIFVDCVEAIDHLAAHREQLNRLAARLGVKRVKNAQELIRAVAARLGLEEFQGKGDGEIFSEVIAALGLPATGNLTNDIRRLGEYIESPVVHSLRSGLADDQSDIEQLYRDLADELGVSTQKCDFIILEECARALGALEGMDTPPGYRQIVLAMASRFGGIANAVRLGNVLRAACEQLEPTTPHGRC